MAFSEVAQIRYRIATEVEAMNRALNGYAAVAQHQIIDNKYTQLGIYQEQLTELIGPTAAIEVMIEELNMCAKG